MFYTINNKLYNISFQSPTNLATFSTRLQREKGRKGQYVRVKDGEIVYRDDPYEEAQRTVKNRQKKIEGLQRVIEDKNYEKDLNRLEVSEILAQREKYLAEQDLQDFKTKREGLRRRQKKYSKKGVREDLEARVKEKDFTFPPESTIRVSDNNYNWITQPLTSNASRRSSIFRGILKERLKINKMAKREANSDSVQSRLNSFRASGQLEPTIQQQRLKERSKRKLNNLSITDVLPPQNKLTNEQKLSNVIRDNMSKNYTRSRQRAIRDFTPRPVLALPPASLAAAPNIPTAPVSTTSTNPKPNPSVSKPTVTPPTPSTKEVIKAAKKGLNKRLALGLGGVGVLGAGYGAYQWNKNRNKKK